MIEIFLYRLFDNLATFLILLLPYFASQNIWIIKDISYGVTC